MDAISLDAIATHPELARKLNPRIRAELAFRAQIAMAALNAAHGEAPIKAAPSNAAVPLSEPLLDYEQAAKFLGCSVRWVKRHPEKCGALRCGRIWRFPPAGLRRLVENAVAGGER